jgi:hypothetical protein
MSIQQITVTYHVLGGATLELVVIYRDSYYVVTVHPAGAVDIEPAPTVGEAIDADALAQILYAAIPATTQAAATSADRPRFDALCNATYRLQGALDGLYSHTEYPTRLQMLEPRPSADGRQCANA